MTDPSASDTTPPRPRAHPVCKRCLGPKPTLYSWPGRPADVEWLCSRCVSPLCEHCGRASATLLVGSRDNWRLCAPCRTGPEHRRKRARLIDVTPGACDLTEQEKAAFTTLCAHGIGRVGGVGARACPFCHDAKAPAPELVDPLGGAP